MNLDTPEGRYAASQALGHDGYNRAMRAHIARSFVETVNGYGIRPVMTGFGRLFAVVDPRPQPRFVSPEKAAFRTIEEARERACALEPAAA